MLRATLESSIFLSSNIFLIGKFHSMCANFIYFSLEIYYLTIHSTIIHVKNLFLLKIFLVEIILRIYVLFILDIPKIRFFPHNYS